MQDKKMKYAKLLLDCLNLSKKRYVFVEIPDFLDDFRECLEEASKSCELDGIHFEIVYPYKRHELMKNLDQENINKHPLFDKSIFDKYAKLDAAFLFIQSNIPGLMDDVDPEIMKNTTLYSRSTQKYFRSLYETEQLNWCIAGVPNKVWAEEIGMNLDEMWELIFKICLVDDETDPYQNWRDKLERLGRVADILNEEQFDKLIYKNSLGTNLEISLPSDHLWCSGYSITGAIVNMPTEEVFTSPKYDEVNGEVYSTKPLLYNNSLIEGIYLKFENGKVIDYDAKTGKDVLKSILETDEYSSYHGEVALVSYDSPISATNVIFKETLYDENASCHLAIGRGFNECLSNGGTIRGDELRSRGVNDSKTHVDFMIGSRDLTIDGIKKNGEKVRIMEQGNIKIEL